MASMTATLTAPAKAKALRPPTRKAKVHSFAQPVIEDEEDELSDEEDLHISRVMAERLETSDGNYVPHDEFWKLAMEVPYAP